MANNIAVIPQVQLPAAILSQFALLAGADDLSAGVSAGFPILSIRGSKWRMTQNGEETPILDENGDARPSIPVILLRANPQVSKTYYSGPYVEGSDAAPDCMSSDGITPTADSKSPQCATCAACPQNVWGSKISPSGAKIKACSDARRMAILPAADLEFSPTLLRIPPASLADLGSYGRALKQRGIPYCAVVTRLAFDHDAAFPKVTFRFERALNESELNRVLARMQESVIDDILGASPSAGAAAAAPVAQAPVQAEAPVPSAPATQTAGGFGGAQAATSSAGAAAATAPSPTASAAAAGFGGKPAPAVAPVAQAAPPAAPANVAPPPGIAAELDAELASLGLNL